LVANLNAKSGGNTSGSSENAADDKKSHQANHQHGKGGRRYTVRCSFLQIYQESVLDLLAESLPQGRAPPTV
jgi:hypothetical protein